MSTPRITQGQQELARTGSREPSAVERLKLVVNSESVKEQFRNALQDNAPLFISSLIDVFSGDTKLQECSANLVVMEALKAATLKLPINKALGFAFLVPFKGKPVMILGYRAYIQLAIRTGLYRHINADVVLEGETVREDRITGNIEIDGTATSSEAQGYFAYIELIWGFKKTLYWTKDKVRQHAERYSKSWGRAESPWTTHFNEMAVKTMIRQLIGKYGIMSVEMTAALSIDSGDERSSEEELEGLVMGHEMIAETVDFIEPKEHTETAALEPEF